MTTAAGQCKHQLHEPTLATSADLPGNILIHSTNKVTVIIIHCSFMLLHANTLPAFCALNVYTPDQHAWHSWLLWILTFSDAVASLVPCRLSAMQLMDASCAGMTTGGRRTSDRSTRLTWPVSVPGYARRELLELGHSTQRPESERQKTYMNILTYMYTYTRSMWAFS
jgi:hypothetical protein